jgi:tryptophan synthase alpha chain
MSDRIAEAFAAARADGRAALMPYLMGGFPDVPTSEAIADAYAEAGADLVELGIPFSDPLADGPVIHAAGTRALAAGASFDSVLPVCRRIADRVPVVPMVYANMVLARGPAEVGAALANAGAAGVIVPDLPFDEATQVHEGLSAAGLDLIPLVAPTTPAERRRAICQRAEGFVYVVSDTRVTGERDELPEHLSELVSAVRSESTVSVAVGFGIGTPDQAAAVGRIADGVIIGSRLVRAVSEAPDAPSAAKEVAGFIADTLTAMRGAGVPSS